MCVCIAALRSGVRSAIVALVGGEDDDESEGDYRAEEKGAG
jgi:hypothetical protein